MGSNVNTLQHMLEHCQTISEYLDEANIKTLKDFTASRIVQGRSGYAAACFGGADNTPFR